MTAPAWIPVLAAAILARRLELGRDLSVAELRDLIKTTREATAETSPAAEASR